MTSEIPMKECIHRTELVLKGLSTAPSWIVVVVRVDVLPLLANFGMIMK